MSPPVATLSAALLSAAAAALVEQVRADPAAPLSVAVSGAGGYGKTTLLHELAAAYRAAGVPVATPWQPAGGDPESAVLLVDDAHLVDDARLRDIAGRAERPGVRTLVAYRPWPRPDALPALIDVLRRHRAPVSLPPLTGPQVRDRAAPALGGDPPPAWTEWMLAQSGGVPRYLDRLVPALSGADLAGPPPDRAPAAALAPFAADFEDLDPDLLTVLLAVEAGAGLSLELVGALLDRDPDRAAALVAAAKATGMLAGTGTLVPLAWQALAVHGPVAHRIDIRQRLAGWQLARGGPVLALISPLLRFMPDTGPDAAIGGPAVGLVPGADGTGLGDAFLAAGDEALRGDPALAARLFAAASRAGRPATARRALATALAGDLDLASLLADQALAGGPPDQRAEAACVAAATLAHRNQLARAVELYRWATPRLAAGFGAVGLVGTGRLDAAERLLAAAPDEPADPLAGPPTLLSTAAYGMARGVCDSAGGSPVTALSALVQAAQLLEPSGSAVLLPDSPAALAALVAVHGAEFGTAQSVLERALETGLGGPLFVRRHRLMLAWTLMAQGRLAAAAEEAARAGVPTGAAAATAAPEPSALPGRDLVFAAALRIALARRNSDLVGLRAAWPQAAQALIGQPVDLFTLLPLGEIAVAAARLGEQRQVQPALAAADDLLRRLGDPALWSVPLHWARLHAATLTDDRPAGERHLAAMREQQDRSPYAAALAAAGQCWLDLLAERIDPDAVEAAARAMAELGLAWDGARLAGQAAIRTPDRKAMTALLDCARSLQARPTAAEPRTAGDRPARPVLSDREQEVATLVLAGLTYKQVADRLYISAKTVEHHMARIRQRLGCTDRRDLLARLRTLTSEPAAPAGPRDTGGGQP
ncbi:helix-turn-helix transcriptional regulator [Jidongwangia harbinensis]|uniref:helix-turn-helix transcriptional regulator n=1 Tax=Jidongwangia harbinensis TaxID=2878561 RepID=UPI001CDA035F|nr:LuxR family transcriptional regulator [Jidongwangia harbinensis]MCA2217810.1 LuxR family transcriptional regulator [Jidongwangia harbinensis]